MASSNSYFRTCDSCLRIGRDRRRGNRASDTSSTKGDTESGSSSRGSSTYAYTSAQPKVTMRSVSKTSATVMSLKQQTLPSIRECVSPKQPPIDSPLFGCNLDDEAWCFNSIASRDSCRSDASWKRFLRNFDQSEFAQAEERIDTEVVVSVAPVEQQASTSGGGGGIGEITPDDDSVEEEEQEEKYTTTISNVQRTTSDPSVVTVDDVVWNTEGARLSAATTQLSGRKYAGQKKEKMKEYKGDPFSRKTVPVTLAEEDQDTPYGSPSPPFSFKILKAMKELPMDEVSTRTSLDLSPEVRRKLETKFVKWNEKDICSSASSIRQRLRHRPLYLSRSAKAVPKKQSHLKGFSGAAQLVKVESMRKAAGVHDGSRKRQAKSERWVRV